jgi:hypothetical protein
VLPRGAGTVVMGMAATLLMLVTAGCHSDGHGGLCGAHPLGREVVPVAQDLEVASNRSIEPEGCGDSYQRRIVLRGANARARERALLRRQGWTRLACARRNDRCFGSPDDGYFVALEATAPNEVVVFAEPHHGLNP